MSADSQHRSKSQSRGSGDPVTVSPQQVTDPTILDSVAGFINDVVPNAYNVPGDCKDQIQWAHFEQLDSDDYAQNGDIENPIAQPLILVLGYTNGVQVWSIPANGEASELFSWKHGSVRVLKLLPTPFRIGQLNIDTYASKRPLIALCDNNTPSPHFCSLSFLSLKTSEQVKVIKFKNPILEVHANRNAIVVTFAERIAVFDAFSLEDRLTVTTCYVSPGIYPNPIALGARWMAYAENKLLTQKRSSGGNEGEGVQSYTATVIHAAKSLGRGLRELGETVASSLTGNVPYKPGISACQQTGSEVLQKGIVTVLDVEASTIVPTEKSLEIDPIVCHFAAHKEAIVCMHFDPTGLLLLTADKRGHDFHLFRIHSHPGGPSLAAVHHLYVLHRGDTTARVQDMCFSPDSRWVTVSTLRGTTHVFPITPYGGHVGVRTHATPHVVNKMSRFHRSAGLTAEGRSNSPVSLFEAPVNSNLPYHNPRLPPYPHPTLVTALAQIRQPVYVQNSTNTQQRPHSGRQRLGSSSEDNIQVVLRLCATFAPHRAWIDNLLPTRDVVHKPLSKPVEALFIMSCHGSLIQYDLDPHSISSVPKEKVCDDTQIELTVRANAQWVLQRQPNGKDLLLPIPMESLKHIYRENLVIKDGKPDHNDDRWLSQVEIVTHAGPHRRLWMGPQFTFKTYNTNSGVAMNILDSKPLDVGRSKPVNMPVSSTYPVLIEAGSVSSCEPSPKLLDICQKNSDDTSGAGELQLKEDLADAMLESPGMRETGGGRCVIVSLKHTTTVAKVVNPLGTVVTVQSDEDDDYEASEEIIHENCDEALFRPVVASKAIIFAAPSNSQQKNLNSLAQFKSHSQKLGNEKAHKIDDLTSKTCTEKYKINKCDSLSEVDSGIEKERSESPLFCDTTRANFLPKGIHSIQRNEPIHATQTHSNYPKYKSIVCDISDTLAEMQFVPLSEPKIPFNIITPPPLEKLDFPRRSQSPEEHLISLQTPTETSERSPEIIEEDHPLKPIKKERKAKNDRYQGLEQKDIISSSEENAVEDKTIPKKPRKPKTKLGVRIININKENDEHKDDVSVDFHISLPKKSWSSIAASKPTPKESIEIPAKTDVECISMTGVSQPILKQNVESNSILSNKTTTSNVLEPEKILYGSKPQDDVDFLKIDKSSDEEKVESSQTETTESDDSTKIPIEVVAMDTEEDACQIETIRSTTCKVNKKKSKKKRGEQSTECIYRDAEDFSSTSSFSSASRASPTPSYSGDNLLHFPGDSSSSL